MSTPKGGSRLGTRFGPYELQSVIGVGGMGEVYRAYDTARERMVAIKLLRPEMAADHSFQERFRRESRVAARLQEPHVIPVHDFGEIDGVLYIDMRLVEGASLKDVLRAEGALPPARAVSILRQVGAALDAAHANGLVHRDIKPENVLLTPDDFAYLVDFGIAHGGGEASVTSTGLVVGSSAYMAPERFSGERGGPASDVYSLACLLYESLTGRAPFEAADVRQVWSAHMFAPPPRPSIMRRGVSRAFDDVVARGMAKQPHDRYPSAGELARAASAAADGAPAAAPVAPVTPPSTRQFSTVYPTPPPMPPMPPMPALTAVPARRFSRGQMGLVAATVVMFTAALALAVVLVFSGDPGAPSPRIAAPPSSSSEAPATSSASAVEGVSGTDSQGFVGHTARCDSGSTPAALIRTSLSLAIICERSSGDFYYRGERLRDGANREIDGARRSGDGFVVTGSDGARYDVQPDQLTISSNGSVDSAEPALEYGSAR
ncbi:serine/threonine protein kinase [Mycolicibacterium austroafricanum]|uniref:non-specific serine/threonine protein kinase n=1 Tax=Mycolicibacterium austroafricanum TaxID=39687 RepID=A0ABT8HHX7_MYCAO|nr:serine/threonine-protein kinase [Mycolicibacterium austroafricanum]MDN4520375.1 serine/threonine-protein kinase [Mycolicibacterium austroafricanum]PQP48393.1 serine/threonine protein kinase [Mycolicibacterium austroafricanum]QRZ07745.1 serine/threonine protein kinase [Mycolicibacterium austroafricanum]QZT69408.1 serine/threonine protein kinase [Mycolicibacterium austroafricanum]